MNPTCGSTACSYASRSSWECDSSLCLPLSGSTITCLSLAHQARRLPTVTDCVRTRGCCVYTELLGFEILKFLFELSHTLVKLFQLFSETGRKSFGKYSVIEGETLGKSVRAPFQLSNSGG